MLHLFEKGKCRDMQESKRAIIKTKKTPNDRKTPENTLSCYSDRIAENHLNALQNTKTLDEEHIVSSGDYLPKTA